MAFGRAGGVEVETAGMDIVGRDAVLELTDAETSVEGTVVGHNLAWIAVGCGESVHIFPWGQVRRVQVKAVRPEQQEELGAFINAAEVRNNGQVVALALLHAKDVLGLDELDREEIGKAFAASGRRPPSSVSQAIADGQKWGGLIERGSGRGLWRLTRLGEETARACRAKRKPLI
jgi:hypothetical protein